MCVCVCILVPIFCCAVVFCVLLTTKFIEKSMNCFFFVSSREWTKRIARQREREREHSNGVYVCARQIHIIFSKKWCVVCAHTHASVAPPFLSLAFGRSLPVQVRIVYVNRVRVRQSRSEWSTLQAPNHCAVSVYVCEWRAHTSMYAYEP